MRGKGSAWNDDDRWNQVEILIVAYRRGSESLNWDSGVGWREEDPLPHPLLCPQHHTDCPGCVLWSSASVGPQPRLEIQITDDMCVTRGAQGWCSREVIWASGLVLAFDR